MRGRDAHLGLYQNYTAKAFWYILSRNPFGVVPVLGLEQQQQTLLRLNAELTRYYKSEAGKTFSRVPELSFGMLGTSQRLHLSAKAHQSLGLLFFVREMLQQLLPSLGGPGRAWFAAADSLVELWEGMRRMPVQLSEVHREEWMHPDMT